MGVYVNWTHELVEDRIRAKAKLMAHTCMVRRRHYGGTFPGLEDIPSHMC